MADEVGSLSVSVGLSTVEFNKGIAGMSKKLQIATQDFRNASGGLDKVSDASKISALKIAELTAKIDIQKGIVDEFREAHARAAEQFGEGSKQALDYELKLKRAEGTLQSMEGQLSSATDKLKEEEKWVNKNADVIANLDKKWDSLKDTLKNGAKVVAVGLAAMGTAFAGATVVGVKMADDLQKALNGVQSSTRTTDEGMGDMRETMLAIYNDNFGEGFEDIGAALAVVAQQTGLTGEALKETTENALMLKDTFGMEVEESVRGVNQVMKQFGVDSETAYNLIAQGAQEGLNANGDLLDTLNEYGGTFEAQGFSAEEMFNMLSNASKSGIRDVDLAADAIKEFGIRSKDGSTTSAAGFEALGLSAGAMTKEFAQGGDTAKEAFAKTTTALLAMKDPVAQNAAGVALFGTQWEDLGLKGVTALVNTKGAITDTTDSLKKINEVKYNTFGEAMEGIKRNLETGILIPFGEKVLPKINEFADWISANMPDIQNEIKFAFDTAGDAISAVGTALQDTKTFFEEHWAIVAPILAGIAAGALTFGIYTLAIAAWSAGTKIATAVQIALNAAMSLNPIGLVVIAIGLLVAAGVALWMNWDTIKVKVAELWTTITTWFGNIKDSIITKIGEWWTAIKNWFSDSKDGIVNNLAKWWNSLKTWFETTLVNIVSKLGDWLLSILKWYVDTEVAIIKKLASWLLSILDWYIDTGKAIVNKLAEWWSDLGKWYDDTKAAVVLKLGEWWTSIKTWYDDTKASIVGKLSEWWTSLKTWYDDTKTNIVNKLAEWWNSLKVWYDDTKTNIVLKLGEWWTAISTWFTGAPSKITTKLGEWRTAFSNWFIGMKDNMLTWGGNIVDGLIKGIGDKIQAVKEKIAEVTSAITGKIRSILGIQSPSTVMQEVGQYMIDGLVVGIGDRAGEVGTAMDGIVSAVSSKVSYLIALGKSMGQDFTNSFRNSINYTPPRGGSGGGGSDGSGHSVVRKYDGDGNFNDYDSDTGNHRGGGIAGTSSNFRLPNSPLSPLRALPTQPPSW